MIMYTFLRVTSTSRAVHLGESLRRSPDLAEKLPQETAEGNGTALRVHRVLDGEPERNREEDLRRILLPPF